MPSLTGKIARQQRQQLCLAPLLWHRTNNQNSPIGVAMKPAARCFALLLMVCFSVTALAAPIAFTPPQQESVNKISGKGGLVMQLANDSDLIVVNLSLGGKTTTDAELAEVKNLPKV